MDSQEVFVGFTNYLLKLSKIYTANLKLSNDRQVQVTQSSSILRIGEGKEKGKQ